MGILSATGAAVSSGPALDQVLRTVAVQMARALEVASCCISDWDPQKEVLTTLVAEVAHPSLGAMTPGRKTGQSYPAADYPAMAGVLRRHSPIAIHAGDPGADAAERMRLERLGQKSLLMVPMVADDQVVGLVELYEGRRVREFTDDEIRLCSALANQAAIAIAVARLYERTDERLQARVDELTAMERITAELNSTLELDHILRIVLEVAIHITGASHGNVMLVDMSGRKGGADPPLTLRVAQGYTEAEEGAIEAVLLAPPDDAVGESLVRQVARSGQAHIVADTWQEPCVVCVQPSTRSALMVPIFYEGLVVGLINLRQRVPGAFDQLDLDFVESLAQQAAVALGNAVRFEEQIRINTTLRERTEQMTRLLEVSRKLRTNTPLQETLEEIAYAIQETVGFNLVLISIVEGEPPSLRRVAAAGLSLRQFEKLASIRQPAECYEVLFRDEYKAGPTYFFPWQQRDAWQTDLHTATSMPEPEEWREGQWHPHDMLLVPLRGAGGRVLGHISVDEPRDGLRPSQRTIEALAIFANQAAIAVENAKLLEERERRIGELAVLNEIAQNISSTLELDALLALIHDQVGRLMDTTNFSIALYDPEIEEITFPFVVDPEGREDWNPRKAGSDPIGRVIRTAQPLLLPEGGRELDGQPDRDRRRDPCASWLAVPMIAEDRVLGVISVQSYTDKHLYCQADLNFLVTVASQAATAVRNAHLYEQIVHFSSELEGMVEARTRDLEQALDELTVERDRVETLYQSQQAEAIKNRAILESIADGVLVLDHSGRVLLVNPAAEELLGLPAAALEGQHLRVMLGLGETPVHRELAQALYAALHHRLEEGVRLEAPAEGSIRLTAGNRALAANIAPLAISLGAAPGVVAALRDISREAEVERLKDELISIVSHELRTPMTSIKGYTDLLVLGMAGGLTDTQRSFLQIIKSNADRLAAVVNDFLDLSRVETGRIRLTIQALDMVELINNVVTSFQEQYREKGIRLVWEAPAELPAVHGDATRVSQVLSNLVDNAWQYTAEGGQVAIAVRRVDGFLQVDIADTGIGIAAQDLDRIFDRFFRADHPMVQEAGGSGLGLSIVKMFVEMLGGKTWVKSEVGIGSTFSFTLPLSSAGLAGSQAGGPGPAME